MQNCIHCGASLVAHEPGTDACPTVEGPYSRSRVFNRLWVLDGIAYKSKKRGAASFAVYGNPVDSVYALHVDGSIQAIYASEKQAEAIELRFCNDYQTWIAKFLLKE